MSWVRTLPVWPRKLPFEEAFALPHDCWDEENSRFRVNMETLRHSGSVKFALVFQQTSKSEENSRASFVVFLGLSFKAFENSNNWPFRSLCSVSFYHTCNREALDLNRPVSPGYNGHLDETCWGRLNGVELGLQCYFSTAIMAGQMMYCADLNASVAPAQS